MSEIMAMSRLLQGRDGRLWRATYNVQLFYDESGSVRSLPPPFITPFYRPLPPHTHTHAYARTLTRCWVIHDSVATRSRYSTTGSPANSCQTRRTTGHQSLTQTRGQCPTAHKPPPAQHP
jgi:hypothetical protein